MRINTEYVYPPIPSRDYDWRATTPGYEPGDPIGTGPTRDVAITDLIERLTGVEHGVAESNVHKFEPWAGHIRNPNSGRARDVREQEGADHRADERREERYGRDEE